MAELEEKEDTGGAERDDDDLGDKYRLPSVLHNMPACLLIYNPQARFHLVVMQSFRYAARKAVFGQNYDSRTYAEFQSSSPNPTTNFWCPLTRYLDPDSRLQQVTHLSALHPPFRLSLLTPWLRLSKWTPLKATASAAGIFVLFAGLESLLIFTLKVQVANSSCDGGKVHLIVV